MTLFPKVVEGLRARGADDVIVFGGGIVPEEDIEPLEQAGLAAIFTPGPPTAGFMGKFWIFSAAIEADYIWLAIVGVVNSAISLFYYFRVIVFMWIKEEVMGSELSLGPAMAITLVITLVGSIFFGIYPQPLFEKAQAAAATLVGTATSSVAVLP